MRKIKQTNGSLTGQRLEEEVDKYRKVIEETPFCEEEEVLALYMDYLRGLALIAEDHLYNHEKEWQISSLAKRFLQYAVLLEPYNSYLDDLYQATSRITDVLYNHPRIKVQLLEFSLLIVQRQNAINGQKEIESAQLAETIQQMKDNIRHADHNELDQIVQLGVLKADPLEWTQQWEDVIDEVEKEACMKTADEPRGMGFCHHYWSVKEHILWEKGINWRSPSAMNPRVLFD